MHKVLNGHGNPTLFDSVFASVLQVVGDASGLLNRWPDLQILSQGTHVLVATAGAVNHDDGI